MEFKKTLAKIALTGLVPLVLAGCSGKHEWYKGKYEFNGTKVEFNTTGGFGFFANTLIEERPDGVKIAYNDHYDDDLKIESIYESKNNMLKPYGRFNEFDKPVIDKAQERFDNLLKQIRDYKVKQGLELFE